MQAIPTLWRFDVAGDLRNKLWHRVETIQSYVGQAYRSGLHQCVGGFQGQLVVSLAELPPPTPDTVVVIF
ncbi:hypothetical protein D3C86_1407550 [compost metagenome]